MRGPHKAQGELSKPQSRSCAAAREHRAVQELFIHLESEHLGKEVGAQIADDDVKSDASAQHQPNHAASTNRDGLGGSHIHPQHWEEQDNPSALHPHKTATREPPSTPNTQLCPQQGVTPVGSHGKKKKNKEN